jgi:predicted nucleotidyltransferase
MAADHGLTPAQLDRVKETLAPFAAHLDRVVLFGSRASGACRHYSDIDLALYGPVGEKEAARLYSLVHGKRPAVQSGCRELPSP